MAVYHNLHIITKCIHSRGKENIQRYYVNTGYIYIQKNQTFSSSTIVNIQ